MTEILDEPWADPDLRGQIDRLLAIMARLRDPKSGCPWDREQSFATIAPYTIEEAYEVEDAIRRADTKALVDELGDLLFQVVFHARMAEEAGQFDFADVVAAVCDKMIRRHPHVFGGARVADAAAQTEAWEAHKRRERGARGALADVALGLPALMRAQKLQGRAARVGFDWDDADRVVLKLDEELGELREARASGDGDRVEDEFGDVLFILVNLARHLKIDAEAALRRTNAKFTSRFVSVEAGLATEGRSFADASLDDMERHWQAAKQRERPSKQSDKP
ncbi:MAG: nucleoside triphosphate pyrophosphohydrolase [Alphaproteobacteria bacterium]|nr:nucleoside triphosphate pyrophosphohydrolase [Alphaproteobacteria bacterium]